MNDTLEKKEGRRTVILPLAAPFMVQVEPTERCNLNCQFCWRRLDPCDSRELSDERWLELADEICGMGVSKVVISGGGEPLLRPELVLRMMERFSRSGIEGSLLTNGTLITEEIARRIVGHQWGAVQFSIHAPTAVLHDAITGMKGSFDLALRGIRALNRQKRLKKSAFPKLAIRTVIFRLNHTLLPKLIAFARSQDAKVVNIKMASGGVGENAFVLSESESRAFQVAVGHARKLADAAGIFLNLELFELDSLTSEKKVVSPCIQSQQRGGDGRRRGGRRESPLPMPCPSPFSEIIIFADGTAAPCPIFRLRNPDKNAAALCAVGLENVTHKPLKTIWMEGFFSLRRRFSEGAPCQTCEECSKNPYHKKVPWPESFFYQKFEHLKKRKLYNEGTAFGLEQLKVYPDSPALHHYLGEFYMELGEYETAIRYLSRAVELDGKLEWTRFSLGKCYYRLGRYAEAEEALSENLEQTSNQESHFHSTLFLAMTADAKGDRSGCEKAFQPLKRFRRMVGKEIALERNFLMRLKAEDRLPIWLKKTLRM